MNLDHDTIAAIATPLGQGGIGIIRISGSTARQTLLRVFAPQGGRQALQPRYLALGRVIDPDSGLELDQALAVIMPGPCSYTGEDVAELHCHGGLRLLEEILALLLRQGCRLATPGEFTLRAFLRGRIDLAQAEAVCDLIEAKTPAAAAQAERQLAGLLSLRLAAIAAELRRILAEIVVGVDFPDDVDAPQNAALLPPLTAAAAEIAQLLAGADLGLSRREGVRAALLGAVNAGKSSLMNALLQRERAIVTSLPGTTRDLLEENLDLAGIPLLLTDTAGLRRPDEADEAERLGIERARAMAAQAGLLLPVFDASQPPDQAGRELLLSCRGRRYLAILNKCDIATEQALSLWRAELAGQPHCEISAKTGDGLVALKDALRLLLGAELDGEGDSPLVNNLRHIEALRRAETHVAAACETLRQGLPADFAGIDIENACAGLDEILGLSVSDEVLKEIFSRFCLGK
ncbi:MAG: tRNA uridine-5-carboxymethylaminomethyl(34) synthesis GTPase MnmE [Clostridia bacterium]|nr:tRNA uridine-5-carboxymethylaminomethyl(34) synthesis GTPase MnmE [Clostridia bacterium]